MKKQIEVFVKDDFRDDTWNDIVRSAILVYCAFYTHPEASIKFEAKQVKKITIEVEYE